MVEGVNSPTCMLHACVCGFRFCCLLRESFASHVLHLVGRCCSGLVRAAMVQGSKYSAGWNAASVTHVKSATALSDAHLASKARLAAISAAQAALQADDGDDEDWEEEVEEAEEEEEVEEDVDDDAEEDEEPPPPKSKVPSWRRGGIKLMDTKLAVEDSLMRTRVRREAEAQALRDFEALAPKDGPPASAEAAAEAAAAAAEAAKAHAEALEKRYRLRRHPRVREQLELWWRATQTAFGDPTTGFAVWAITEQDYVDFLCRSAPRLAYDSEPLYHSAHHSAHTPSMLRSIIEYSAQLLPTLCRRDHSALCRHALAMLGHAWPCLAGLSDFTYTSHLGASPYLTSAPHLCHLPSPATSLLATSLPAYSLPPRPLQRARGVGRCRRVGRS